MSRAGGAAARKAAASRGSALGGAGGRVDSKAVAAEAEGEGEAAAAAPPKSEQSQAHPRRRHGWDRTARFAVVVRTEMVPERDPLELLRKLFYVFIDYAHAQKWQWTPMQDRAAPLLDTRDGKTAGSSLAFARCFTELALTLGHGYEEDDLQIVTFGEDRPWISVPYSRAGVDPDLRGNLVEDGKLRGRLLLAKHSFVYAFGHVFDPAFGIETSVFRRPTGWKDHVHNVVYAWLDERYAEEGLRSATQFDVAPARARKVFVAFDWSPREWKMGAAACEAAGVEVVEPDVDDAKGFLRMTYPGTGFKAEEPVRARRLGAAGFFLWHTHKDGKRQESLEKEREMERKAVERARQERIARIKQQRKEEAMRAMGS
eukprot:CAMPEP_0203813856 /NCGR_PEP_ID=MMETSP0115-20131106/4954_1 /ASSEMBLY_ACC=CAM_ASM_000227 /TAXON_ID=33651 /ORGANISM="Bicosoecid sp, Strain ms1" /LENGTH=371 /DNA_ID=CAMNT_0050722731 /DNA_START=208 /DNA_END=1323 /DNA_ORIENTATION=-